MGLKYTLSMLSILLAISIVAISVSSYNMGKNDLDKNGADFKTDKIYLHISTGLSVVFLVAIFYFAISSSNVPDEDFVFPN